MELVDLSNWQGMLSANAIKTGDDLKILSPELFKDKILAEEVILDIFAILGAYWAHSGDPKDPHVELTSGKCSNGFFDCLRVLKYVNLSDILANQLAIKIRSAIGSEQVDCVIGSPMAGITFSHDVARSLGAPISVFVEKNPEDPKKMLWKRDGMFISAEANALQVEELITTAQTLNEVKKAIEEGNPDPVTFLPIIGALVHRPSKIVREYGDRQLVALVEKEVWNASPDECSLCKKGSKRVRAKTHWAELTGKK